MQQNDEGFYQMDVPKFKEYYATISSMDNNQKLFYEYWLSKWNNGEAIPVNGQISYLFCYLYPSLELPIDKLVETLIRMINAYSEETYFIQY